MPLNKILTAQDEAKVHAANLGTFPGLAHAVSHNAGLAPMSMQTDRQVQCSLSETNFFARLDELEALNDNDGYGIGRLGSAYIVYSKDFNANTRAFKVINRTATEKFTKTIKDASGSNQYAINGSFVDFNTYFVNPYSPVPASSVDTVGKVYKGGSLQANYKESPLGFSVKFASAAFTFAQGDANGGDALGGMTPILLYNPTYSKVWKYGGDGNKYQAGASGPSSGDPGASGDKLTIRNNLQYKDQNAAGLGKTIFAWHPSRDAAVCIVQKNGITNGKTLDWYRDCLYNKGFQYALGFDGSDSATLYDYKTSRLLVVPGSLKDNSLRTAIRIQN